MHWIGIQCVDEITSYLHVHLLYQVMQKVTLSFETEPFCYSRPNAYEKSQVNSWLGMFLVIQLKKSKYTNVDWTKLFFKKIRRCVMLLLLLLHSRSNPFSSVITKSLFPSKYACLDTRTLTYLVMYHFLCLMITFIDFIQPLLFD